MSFAAVRLLGGLTFSLGLALVIVGGAELFTGNNLIVMAWASGKVSTREMLRNWAIVYLGNLVGSLGLVFLVFFSHHLDMNGGRIGLSILNTSVAKIQPDVVTLFFKGVLCNVLVCLAVWLAYAGRTVTDKLLALILPVSAFIAAGFEHCVANMYFLPLAWLLVQTGNVPTNFDASLITTAGIIHNLVPVTLGNIVGGPAWLALCTGQSIGRRLARRPQARTARFPTRPGRNTLLFVTKMASGSERPILPHWRIFSSPPMFARACVPGVSNVRYGSKADLAARLWDVCFTPDSGH